VYISLDVMDEGETGINVVTIEMKRTNVPQPVQPSFDEVNQAIQEKERMIYQAREEELSSLRSQLEYWNTGVME
jgi:regulator of protease activity HflC (stomatin/prohibitin superfamily)